MPERMRRAYLVALTPIVLAACVSCGQAGSNQTKTAPTRSLTPTPAASPSLAVTRCRTDSLGARLGAATAVPRSSGQYRLALVFTNTGTRPCTLRGYPGVELRGPSDPNGPTYQLPESPATPATVVLAPGGTADAMLTYLKWEPGDMGSLGSTRWIPTRVVISLPGETGRLSVAWTSHDPVLRQDAASHPGTYVGPLLPG